MDTATFWNLIDAARATSRGDKGRMTAALAAALRPLGAAGVAAFQRRLDDHMAKAFTWPLWGAAYIINGGCSDDGFEYFRALLIANGREVYERAVADPDALASIDLAFNDDGYFEFESFLYVTFEVYEDLTGDGDIPRADSPIRPEPAGRPWSEDGDDLPRLLPNLARKYGLTGND